MNRVPAVRLLSLAARQLLRDAVVLVVVDLAAVVGHGGDVGVVVLVVVVE